MEGGHIIRIRLGAKDRSITCSCGWALDGPADAIDQLAWEDSTEPMTRAVFDHAPAGWVEYLLPDGTTTDTRRSWGEAGVASPHVIATLEFIAEAFAGVPRPPNEALLHDDCRDDGDIVELYGVPDWREAPDKALERSYAALTFLSPAGFQYFLPAYLSWVLRHAGRASAVVDSTIWSLEATPGPHEAFAASKFELLDDAQRTAVVSFLTTMASFEDVTPQLEYWQART